MRLVDIMTPNVISAQATESVAEAVRLMHLYRVAYLPVLAGNELRGVLSEKDIHPSREFGPEVMDMCLDDVLAVAKPQRLVTAAPLATLDEARVLLADCASGYLLVRAHDGDVIGFVTSADVQELGCGSNETMVPTDGRNEPRVELNLKVQEFVGDEPVLTRFRDISTTGASLSTFGPSPLVGEIVALEWSFSDEEPLLWAAGRVRRLDAPVDGASHAVEFLALAREDRERIRRFVHEGHVTERRAPRC